MTTPVISTVARATMLGSLLFFGCGTPPDSSPVRPADVTQVNSSTEKATVDARAGWVPTGLTVKAGQKISFSATGSWGESPGVTRSADGGTAGIFGSGYWGAERPLATAPWGALLGRVGTGVFLIGVESTLVMPQDGQLLLGINDAQGNSLTDNHGYLTVTIIRQ